jgi:hypothetical protein
VEKVLPGRSRLSPAREGTSEDAKALLLAAEGAKVVVNDVFVENRAAPQRLKLRVVAAGISMRWTIMRVSDW